MKNMNSLEKIIDLEYFLHQDTETAPEELHRRDRQIALQLKPETSEKTAAPEKSNLLAGWLAHRLHEKFSSSHTRSPGTVFGESRNLATLLIGLKGVVAGALAGWAFFAYAGTTPINVLQFLLFFVVTQLIVTLLLIAAACWRKLFPGFHLPMSQFYLFSRFAGWLFKLINQHWYEQVDAKNRASVHHAFGIIKSKTRSYGSLFYWPFFSLAQLFGITFNAGLLTASLIKIMTSDLAFGWQSTIQFSSDAILKMVHWLALPWGWILPPGIGTPTLVEIEGSRIILKDGIYHLATENLIAWWPFLICCLICYGLLIRILLYATGRVMEGRTLAAQKFNSPQCAALFRRMTTPIVTTQAAREEGPPQKTEVTEETVEAPVPKDENLGRTIVFIPDDIYDNCPDAELGQFLAGQGLAEIKRYRFMAGYDEDQELLETLAGRQWEQNETIFILMEGWMVPLVDFIVFLKELRKRVDFETVIELGLTGQEAETFLTAVTQNDLTIWREKIEAIGDPFIRISPIKGMVK